MTSVFKVEAAFFSKSLEVPTSKSYANRVLILAAITPGETNINHLPESSDVKTMLTLLEKLGLDIKQENNTVSIFNSFPECEGDSSLTLETGDGGTTNRFILPLLARGKQEYTLEAEGHMRNRPMDPIIDALCELDVKVSKGEDYWIRVQGPYTNEKRRVEVDSKNSTQFATGLSLSTADMEINIVPKNLEASQAYYLMTKHLIEEFRAQQTQWEIPVDFSGISYPLALGAVTGKVNVPNCKRIDAFQADSVFLKILEEMGVELHFSDDGLTLEKPEYLMPFEVDGSGCPDLVPTLSFIASYAAGTSLIRNIEVLRHKESDRVEETLKLLDTFKIKYEFNQKDHNLIIFGNPDQKVDPVEYHPPEDHRIIMVAYLFLRVNCGGSISNANHVKKSFPNFFESMS